MLDIKELFKELYLSLETETVGDRENIFYELLLRQAMTHLKSCKCTRKTKNQILGEMILIGKDVVEECSSIS